MTRNQISAVLCGNALEYYCLTLYGFMALDLAPLFFPNQNEIVAQFLSFVVFALGFLMRPVGAIIFGHMGDKYGRKNALLLSILLITIPTTAIGLLPTYEKIGILAPILVGFARLLQGFCNGGESTGAAVFMSEHLRQNRDGFWGSILSSSSLLGALIATGFAFLATHQDLPDWSWRVPFLVSFLFGIIGYVMRTKLTETPDFLEIKSRNQIESKPLVSLLKTNSNMLIACIGVSAASVMPFYLSAIYLNKVVLQTLNVSFLNSFFMDTSVMILWMLSFPIFGHLADKVSPRIVMQRAAIAMMILSAPLYYLLTTNLNTATYFIAQTLIAVCGAAFAAPINAFVPKTFKQQGRYTGFALSFALGATLLGGTTPLIVSYLGQMTSAPSAYYIFITGMLGMFSLWGIQHIKKNYKSQ